MDHLVALVGVEVLDPVDAGERHIHLRPLRELFVVALEVLRVAGVDRAERGAGEADIPAEGEDEGLISAGEHRVDVTGLGQHEAAARHREQAEIDWRAHERDQAQALACIDKAVASMQR